MTKRVDIGNVAVGAGGPLVIIAGPCAIEDRDTMDRTAEGLMEACGGLGLPLIFKSSFDKANRTSVSSRRGPGMEEGLRVLADIKARYGLPVISDVHEAAQCAGAAQVLDCLQIPAFLCRQTDLIVAAAETGRPVNVKKGQFLAPWDMRNIVQKVRSTGNEGILLTERGTSFGYNTLVVDFRGLPLMRAYGYPVVFDVTHSVQQPGGRGDSSGGEREFAETLARAAVAVGVDALFIEVHPEPERAVSDGANMIRLADAPGLLGRLKAIHETASAL